MTGPPSFAVPMPINSKKQAHTSSCLSSEKLPPVSPKKHLRHLSHPNSREANDYSICFRRQTNTIFQVNKSPSPKSISLPQPATPYLQFSIHCSSAITKESARHKQRFFSRAGVEQSLCLLWPREIPMSSPFYLRTSTCLPLAPAWFKPH